MIDWKRVALSVSALIAVSGTVAAQTQALPKFMGRQITVSAATRDKSGYFPEGPVTICVEGPPKRQCFTTEKEYGLDPRVRVVEFRKGSPAILFSANSGGVSGWGVRLALLRPGDQEKLTNLFFSDTTISNLGQNAFSNEPAISDTGILLTADWEYGPDEAHYTPHRYMISAYALRSSNSLDDPTYFLEDRFMTVRKYDTGKPETDILKSERPEILARLRRAKAGRQASRP